MRLPIFICSFVSLFVSVFSNSPPYFLIDEPSTSIQWGNNATNYITWTIDAGKEISVFDVELGRLSTDGLYFIARNVPINAPVLPIVLENVPPGDDYYVIFLNVTHGLVYSVSQRFSVLQSGQPFTDPSRAPSTNKRNELLATVTVSGIPNPTTSFLHTFAAISRGDRIMATNSYWTSALLLLFFMIVRIGLY